MSLKCFFEYCRQLFRCREIRVLFQENLQHRNICRKWLSELSVMTDRTHQAWVLKGADQYPLTMENV